MMAVRKKCTFAACVNRYTFCVFCVPYRVHYGKKTEISTALVRPDSRPWPVTTNPAAAGYPARLLFILIPAAFPFGKCLD